MLLFDCKSYVFYGVKSGASFVLLLAFEDASTGILFTVFTLFMS